jgi:NAD(P)H-nitrite reductase large subunit
MGARGVTLQADAVLIGIGIQAGVEVAQAAGIAVARGILVNRKLQTSVAHVYAAGDGAELPSHVSGGAEPDGRQRGLCGQFVVLVGPIRLPAPK